MAVQSRISQSLVETGVESGIGDFSWGRIVEVRKHTSIKETRSRISRFYQQATEREAEDSRQPRQRSDNVSWNRAARSRLRVVRTVVIPAKLSASPNPGWIP